MKSFLALVSLNGALCPELMERIPVWADRALAFRHMPYRRATWQSRRGDMALFAWANEPEANPGAPLIQVDDERNRAVALTGYVAHAGMGDPWSAGAIAATGSFADSRVSSLGGMFALAEADGQEGRITIWKSASRAVPLYWAQTRDYVAVGTRALLLSFLVTGAARPVYDMEGMVPFLTRGRFASDRTAFRDVHPVPPNATVVASSAGIVIRPTDDFERLIGTVEPAATDLDLLVELLMQSVRPLRGRGVMCSLTGGKDSRLVAAVLTHAGAEVRARTSGFPESADVQAARRVADVLGIAHETTLPGGLSVDDAGVASLNPAERARAVLFAADGMLSAYENLIPPARYSAHIVSAGGHGGEVALRDSFASGPLTWDQAAAVLRSYYIYEPQLFLPEAVERHTAKLDAWLRREEATGGGPIAALDRFAFHFDLGVSGVGPIVTEVGRPGWYPLMDNQVVKAGLQAHPRIKISEELLFQLLKRLDSRLVALPFADKRWNFERRAPRRGDEEGWARRAPITAAPGTRGTFNWRRNWSRELWEVFYEQIFGDERAAALFEVIDREVFDMWFQRRRGVPDAHGTAIAWATYSASILLSGSWLEANAPGPAVAPVRMALPAD